MPREVLKIDTWIHKLKKKDDTMMKCLFKDYFFLSHSIIKCVAIHMVARYIHTVFFFLIVACELHYSLQVLTGKLTLTPASSSGS